MPVGVPVYNTEPSESGEERRPDRVEQQARETTSYSVAMVRPRVTILGDYPQLYSVFG